jgi:HTH-type transcriptional regulator/antitoxin HigA
MLHGKKTIAIPPGETIKEQLADRGINQKEFALRMVLTEKHVSQLINGKVALTQDVALRLESVLGIPAKFWNSLEANYREKLARVVVEQTMEQDEAIAGKMPYVKISSWGWIPITKNIQERVSNLRAFFEVACLGALDNLKIPGITYRKAGTNESIDYHLACWAQKARLEARKMSVAPVNIDKLKKSISDIRMLTVQSPKVFCRRLHEIMSGCGVALVFLPHIGSSFLHGASFVDGKRIVIGLTVRGKYADKFWFSLFHELCHVIEGHIFDDENRAEQEGIADTFAQDVLIPEKDYREFISRNDLRKTAIVSFARAIGIAPGIVLGRLQKDNFVRYSAYTELKGKYEIAA